jgi:hypothetical protein
MDRSSLASVNKSTNEERTYNMNFLKMLYTLYAFQLLVAFTLSSFAVVYENSFDWLASIWIVCILFLGACLGLIIVTMISPVTRQPPLNFLIYLLFTVLFTFGIACFSMIDSSGLVYFILATLTLIAVGFMLYAM